MCKKKHFLIFFLLILVLSACSNEEMPVENFSPTPVPIELYSSPTPAIISNTPTPLVQSTNLPLPTATPVLYKVVASDTLIGIAYRYGITLPELLGANPGVSPEFLSIGAELLIPLDGSQVGVAILPEELPEELAPASDVKCYLSLEGGLTCLWSLNNDNEFPLENISAKISLLNNNAEIVNEGTAILPINLLPAGETIPVLVYFPFIGGPWSQTEARVLTALSVINSSERYLNALLSDLTFNYGDSAMFSTISGLVGLADPEQSASEVWILAIAYDQESNVVGVRRWESDLGLQAGEQQGFSINVYSLGPPISEVKLFIEARP